jgi:hypothetical protein
MSRRLLLLTIAALLALPATAIAAPPWSQPSTVPNALASSTPLVVTPSGAAALLAPVSRTALGSTGTPSELVPLGSDGTPGTTQPVSIAAGLLASYAKGHIAVAGSTLVTGTITDRSHAAVALGTPSALGAAHGLTGGTGQHVFGLAGNVRGDLAVVTGDASHVRTLYVRRAGTTTFSVGLRIAVGSRARGATVAVGSKGDVLVVWEDNHRIFARHLGPTGHAGSVHQIGDGVQSQLQAAIDASGRLEVAWESQRVDEGEANTPAVVRYATAAPGHGFGPQRTVETVGAVGTGAVAAPGVRLVSESDNQTLLAWTGFASGHFVVRAADVTNGHRGSPQTLSPADAVLGDAASGADGAATVVWRSATGTAFASHRGAGASAFGAPEQVSQSGENVATSPFAAVDPVTGRSFVAYAPLGAGLEVSARP